MVEGFVKLTKDHFNERKTDGSIQKIPESQIEFLGNVVIAPPPPISGGTHHYPTLEFGKRDILNENYAVSEG